MRKHPRSFDWQRPKNTLNKFKKQEGAKGGDVVSWVTNDIYEENLQTCKEGLKEIGYMKEVVFLPFFPQVLDDVFEEAEFLRRGPRTC
jgi:hypothetical protein